MSKKNRYLIDILSVFLIGIILVITFSIFTSSEPTPLETKIVRIKNIGLEMVYIPAGEFQMGSKDGWAYGADIVRPGRRDGSGPKYATNLIGFRLAASKFPPKKQILWRIE